MTTRSHGFRVGTRRALRKRVKKRGKVSIKSMLQKFKVGDKVIVKVEPAYHKAMPYKRYFGKQGKIVEKRSKSYVIAMKDERKTKKIITAPVHLRKA